MQHPVYKFHKGQVVYADRDFETHSLAKSVVVHIFDDDTFDNGQTLRLIVTKEWLKHKQRHHYAIYREYELSSMMYMLAEMDYNEQPESIKSAIKKYEVDRVYDYKNGHLVEIPKNEWNLTQFK